MPILQSILHSVLEVSVGAGARLGLVDRRFDYDRILAAASEIAGTTPTFRSELTETALRVLLQSLDEEAGLSALGAALAKRKLTSTVANRLRLEAVLAESGNDIPRTLREPVFIAGLPRTGTTLLHRLLAEHDGFRTLRLAEVLEPFSADSHMAERRADEIVHAIALLAPAAMEAHPMAVDLPAECQHLMEATFVAAFFVHFDVPAYWQWMMTLSVDELAEACGHYGQLAAIATHREARFLSKAPAHALYGAALPVTFPDMWVIRTHRPVESAVPSLANLIALYRRIFSRNVSRDRIGQLALDVFRLGGQRMIEMQERMRHGRAIDIDYLRLVADPVGTSMAVFDRLGLETSGDVEDRLRQRLSVERVHERSAASYSLHQFGLTEAGIHEATSVYSEWVGQQAML
jgi:hypothetical protein